LEKNKCSVFVHFLLVFFDKIPVLVEKSLVGLIITIVGYEKEANSVKDEVLNIVR